MSLLYTTNEPPRLTDAQVTDVNHTHWLLFAAGIACAVLGALVGYAWGGR